MSVTSSPKQYVLQLRRTIKTPVQRLYQAFEREHDRARWFAERTVVEPEPGGKFISSDGTEAEFLEVQPMELWRLEWRNPRHSHDSQVVIRFRKVSRGESAVFIRHWRINTVKEYQELYNDWLIALDSLEQYLEYGQYVLPSDEASDR